MGSVTSVVFAKRSVVKVEVKDSPSGHGLCAISGDMDDFFEPLGLFFAILAIFRKPWYMPSVEILKSTPLELVIEHKIDAATIRAYGKDPGTEEFPDIRFIHYPDRRSLRVDSTMWFKEAQLVRQAVLVHVAPLRVEMWAEKPGARVAGEVIAGIVSHILKYILKRRPKDPAENDSVDVKVNPEGQAVFFPGTQNVVMTQALDEFIDYDTLWAEWIDYLKYQPASDTPGLKFVEIEGEESPENLFTTFTTKHVISADVAGTEHDEEQVRRFCINRGRGVLFVEEWNKFVTQAPTRFCQVFHKDPLRVEAWAEEAGERDMEPSRAAWFQACVDHLIEESYAKKEEEKKQLAREAAR